MKLVSALLFAVSLLFSGVSLADDVIGKVLPDTGAVSTDEGLAIGATSGAHDGISLMYRTSKDGALQSTISLGDDSNYINVDRLFMKPEMFRNEYAVPYVGVGYYRDNANGFVSQGVRVPIGILLNVPESPLQLSLEMAPAMEVHPDVETSVEKSMGVRYAF